MKAFLVLLLVAIAASGLFFVLRDDGTDPAGGGASVVREEDPAPVIPPVDKGNETLANVGNSGSRTEGEIKVGPTVVQPSATEGEFAVLGAGSLAGTVVDEKGGPIFGATVTLTRFGSESFFFSDIDRSQDVLANTGTDGAYSFENVPAFDSYALIADHPDYSRSELPAIVVQDGVRTDAAPIVLRPGVALRGRITDSGGNVVPGARLLLSQNMFVAALPGEDSGDAAEAISDERGNYVFANVAPQQNYALTVDAEGYGRVQESPVAVSDAEDTVKDIVLQVASMVAGTVMSTAGEPIEGAAIQVFSMDRAKARTNSSTESLELGDFEISNIPPGRYLIVARHPRYQAQTNIQVESGDMTIAIELQPLPVVTGQVVDLSTGAPVPQFVAQLRQQVPGALDPMSTAIPATRMQFNDPSGRFELVLPKEGEYMVEAMAQGFADTYSEPFTATLGTDATGIVVRMTRGGTLIGRIVGEGGVPISGATVQTHDKEWSDDMFWQAMGDMAPGNATEATVRTAADGSFKIEHLTPANYQLVVQHREFAQEKVKDLVVTEGQEARVGDVVLLRGASITGQVIGPSGSPLAGATVKLFHTTPDAKDHVAQTNSNGEYTINNVREGSYKIHASRPRTSSDNPFVENVDMKNTQKVLSVTNGTALEGIDFKLSDR